MSFWKKSQRTEHIVPPTKVYLALSAIKGAGRGMFASETIEKGELIERCPVITIEKKEVPLIRDTLLRKYYFMEGINEKSHRAAICLGFGSIYNHSYSPNATYKKYIHEGYIDFIALRSIKKGEEICTNYNHGDPNDTSTLWIDSIPPYK